MALVLKTTNASIFLWIAAQEIVKYWSFKYSMWDQLRASNISTSSASNFSSLCISGGSAKVMNLCLYVQAQPVALRSILRDDETFSTHLTQNLSVPASVAQSLINAKILVNPVSIISQLCSFPSKNPNRFLKQEFPSPINKGIQLRPQYSEGWIYFEQCA